MSYKEPYKSKDLINDNVKCSVGRWRNDITKLEGHFDDSMNFLHFGHYKNWLLIVSYKTLFSFQVHLYNFHPLL